jgi:hypothetical protein
MHDPHVDVLYYSLGHPEGVDYSKARPLSHDTPSFTIRVEKGCAEVMMKTHHAIVETARAEVEPFLRAWELTAALEFGPGEFELAYARPRIIDRNPTPGISAAVATASGSGTATAEAHVERSKYPDPPSAGIARDAAVELMFKTYCLYREKRMKLGDAANFCLTVLEEYSGASGMKRPAAARRFAVAKPILDKIGTLAGEKGGAEARKARGVSKPFSLAERQWLEVTMKRLILRAGEVAGNPSASLPKITMAELPSLSGE